MDTIFLPPEHLFEKVTSHLGEFSKGKVVSFYHKDRKEKMLVYITFE
jgi:hypothetical protein